MRGGCELCGKEARMYCESDQAILCWKCDEKVHSANFLVAKHTRVLLCHSCQNHTPWMASGSKLGPTISLCQSCSIISNNGSCPDREERRSTSLVIDEAEAEYYSSDDDDDDEEEEEEDGENQVVPWSPYPPPPPVVASSSSSYEGGGGGRLKRVRGLSDSDLDVSDVCQDEFESSSFQLGIRSGQGRVTPEEGNSMATSITPSKRQTIRGDEQGLGQRNHQHLNGQDGSR